MTHGSLFSGIGGFDLAAEWMGWDNKFHCEWNDFGRRILKYYWPEAKSYGDITKTDFTIWRGRIDILTGGFPCQPFSMAGKRMGTDDGRYLWPEYLRAIREIKPLAVVGENVTGLLSMEQHEVFARVDRRIVVRYEDHDHYEGIYTRQATMLVNDICEDLEKEGYRVQAFVIPAAGVGAPHRRDRVWFIAHSDGAGTRKSTGGFDEPRELFQEAGRQQNKQFNKLVGPERTFAYADGPIKKHGHGKDAQKKGEIRGYEKGDVFGELSRNGDVTNTNSLGRERREKRRKSKKKPKSFNEQFKGHGELFGQNWKNFPTQPPVRFGNDGIPPELDRITFPKWRNETIKAAGNAIVPHVAYKFFKAINNYEDSIKDGR